VQLPSHRTSAVLEVTKVSKLEVRSSRDICPASDRAAKGLLLLILAVVCAITWRKWGSLIVDCGREMYIPAILSQGKRLYFDAWYPYGPLIPYWHALLFRIFGVHLWILQTMGIGIVALITLMTYSLSRKFLPVSLAFAAGFAVVIQAFQLTLFNYVQPYSWPAAYGVLLFVALVWLLVNDSFAHNPWLILAAGSLAGLEAINKIEFGAAAYIVLAAAILLRAPGIRSFGRLMKDLAACAPGLILCVAIWGWLVARSSPHFIFAQNITVLPDSYFVRKFGATWASSVGYTSAPTRLLEWTAVGLLGVALIGSAVCAASASKVAARLVFAAAIGLCAFHVALTFADRILHRPIPELARFIAPTIFFNGGMAMFAVVLAIYLLVRWWKAGRNRDNSALTLLAIAAAAQSSRALVKIEPYGYAIFYDTLSYVAFLVIMWKAARHFGASNSKQLWICTSGLLCCGLVSLVISNYGIYRRPFLVSTPRGSVYTRRETGEAFTQALTFLNQVQSRGDRFVIWPEEAALYYFTGTVAPSRWYALTPGILPEGSLTVEFLDDLDRHQVNYVLLSNRATPEYGVPFFGVDYNREIYRWLVQNFRVVRTFGEYQRVVSPTDWAAQVWERKSALPDRTE
jgi:hypothetical protein